MLPWTLVFWMSQPLLSLSTWTPAAVSTELLASMVLQIAAYAFEFT